MIVQNTGGKMLEKIKEISSAYELLKGNYGIESAVKAQIVTTNTTVYDLVL